MPVAHVGGIYGAAGNTGDTSFGSGRVMWSSGAPVNNPTPGPVFLQRVTPVRFILPPPHPRAGRIGSSFGAVVQNPSAGHHVAPHGPVRPRIPLPRSRVDLRPRSGERRHLRCRQRIRVRRWRGLCGCPRPQPHFGICLPPGSTGTTCQASLSVPQGAHFGADPGARRLLPPPVPGPVFRPADRALRARLPQQPVLRGRVTSTRSIPVYRG